MKIGIKYCGGCNSRYDRTKEVGKLKKKFPQHEFAYANDHTIYDICLLVCGCMTACAAPEGTAAKRFELLCTPAQFSQLASSLSDETSEAELQVRRVLHIGDTASLDRTFTESDIHTFAVLTGNYGKLHTDPAFAARHGSGRITVPGDLAAGLLSALTESQLPGDGSVLLSQQIRFAAPVYAGDTITAAVTLTAVTAQEDGLIGELHGTCRNQDGVLVASGTYQQTLPAAFFTIED